EASGSLHLPTGQAIEDNPDGDVLGKVLEMMLRARGPRTHPTLAFSRGVRSAPNAPRDLTPITEYFEFCCDLSFLRSVSYSQPSIRFFQHKERCLINHK